MAWNFVCDLDTGLIVSARTSERTNEDLRGIFSFSKIFLFNFTLILATRIYCIELLIISFFFGSQNFIPSFVIFDFFKSRLNVSSCFFFNIYRLY